MKTGAHKHTRIRWSMLVSHHPPCDYDRTVRICGVRVCTRCLGMVAGGVLGLLLAQTCAGIGLVSGLVATLAMTLPAACDFAAHELSVKYRSTNPRRFATGITFGFVVGACLGQMRQGNPWPFLGLLAYLALMQVAIVRLFQMRNHCDSYLDRYASAVYKETESNKSVEHYVSPGADAG